jgi:hypothetical protein
MVLAGGDLAFEAGCQELFVAPALGSGSFAETADSGGEGRRLEGPAQEGDVRGWLGRRHQPNPTTRS